MSHWNARWYECAGEHARRGQTNQVSDAFIELVMLNSAKGPDRRSSCRQIYYILIDIYAHYKIAKCQ